MHSVEWHKRISYNLVDDTNSPFLNDPYLLEIVYLSGNKNLEQVFASFNRFNLLIENESDLITAT